MRGLAALAAALLTACAPDYTPVRDWSTTASRAADYPQAAGGGPALTPRAAGLVAARAPAEDLRAMQEVLVAYLDAVATLAADGTLPHMEDPFTAQAARTASSQAEASQAITGLGALMRYATRGNARAPQLRDTIRTADPHVQVLAAALARAAVAPPGEDAERATVAAHYAGLARAARDAPTRRAMEDLGALRDREFATRAAARAAYAEVVTQIAAGHALLVERSGHLTQEETARQIRAAEDRLRRAAAALPATAVRALP